MITFQPADNNRTFEPQKSTITTDKTGHYIGTNRNTQNSDSMWGVRFSKR